MNLLRRYSIIISTRRAIGVFLAMAIALSCVFKNNKSKTSITLIYDEPVNGYYMSGTFYPFGPTTETGQVEFRFVPVNGGEALVFSNVDCFEDDNPEHPSKYTDKNICDYVFSEGFSGFHDGDSLICHYNDAKHPFLDSPLNYDAGFLFFDVDFDGEDELLINDYYRGRCGNHYTVYEITSEGFVLKNEYPFNSITNETQFYPETKQVYIRVDEDKFELVNLLLNAKPFDDTADTFQCKIMNTLKGDALDAYKKEREAFSAWYEYQNTISEEVIGDIWELYAGGSAGWTFQEGHLYDIAKANASEQVALYEALIKRPSNNQCRVEVTMQQIESAKEKLVTDYSELYSQYENIGPDGWPKVDNTHIQISEYLDKDLALFNKWITDREILESLLKRKLRTYYESLSADWKNLYLQKYKEHFIHE